MQALRAQHPRHEQLLAKAEQSPPRQAESELRRQPNSGHPETVGYLVQLAGRGPIGVTDATGLAGRRPVSVGSTRGE